MPDRKPFIVIGHRGDGAGPDENTLASCRRAIAHGADAVELDVQLIDGELMVAHPPRRPQESLRTVLDGIDCPVVLHLGRRHFSRRHDRRALAKLAEVRHRPGIMVSSRWPGTLAYGQRQFPKLRTALVAFRLGPALKTVERLGLRECHSLHWGISERAVAKAHEAGIRVFTYTPTINHRSKLERLGVDAVITDSVSAYARRRPSGTRRQRTSRPTSPRPRSR